MEADTPLENGSLISSCPTRKSRLRRSELYCPRQESEAPIPELPLIFLKPSSAVIGPGETIRLPPQSQQVDHEAELVVVIGKRGRWVPAEQAYDIVLGYTVGNDVTARDLQLRDGQWTRSKGFDTFCPIGPWIETEFDPSDGLISCYVNQEMRQMASTRDMIFTVRQLIAFISSVMTLEPGDINHDRDAFRRRPSERR